MCSFGGKILPRPHDSQLRYVGGDTRVVAVHRNTTTFSSLLNKLSRIANKTNLTVKYQLPNEDLDALITVTTDEDVENMIDEYDRFHLNTSQSLPSPRLGSDFSSSKTTAFRGLAALAPSLTGPPIENTDPGSPNPVASTPFCSTSSSLAPPGMPSIPELPPVKTKSDEPVRVVDPKEDLVETFMDTGETFMRVNEPVTGYSENSTWHYVSDPHYPTQGLRRRSEANGSSESHVMATRVIPEGLNQAMYYGMRNGYPGMAVPGGEELQVNGPDGKESRVFHS
ncbi:hypothetical protein C3L33_06344, partial [Rhododendron williamsianum]